MALNRYLDDLKPEAFLVRPVAGVNHIAWQVGYLISVKNKLVEALKPGSSPALPDGFHEHLAMDKHDSDDRAKFRTKDDYLALWKAQRATTRAVFDGLSETDLHAPCPDEKTRAMCPSVATMFSLSDLLTLLHAWQFVAVRRHEEMPIAF